MHGLLYIVSNADVDAINRENPGKALTSGLLGLLKQPLSGRGTHELPVTLGLVPGVLAVGETEMKSKMSHGCEVNSTDSDLFSLFQHIALISVFTLQMGLLRFSVIPLFLPLP